MSDIVPRNQLAKQGVYGVMAAGGGVALLILAGGTWFATIAGAVLLIAGLALSGSKSDRTLGVSPPWSGGSPLPQVSWATSQFSWFVRAADFVIRATGIVPDWNRDLLPYPLLRKPQEAKLIRRGPPTDIQVRVMRLTRLLTILLASCAIPASASALDSALQEARLEEMAGDRQGAAHMLASWLDSNPGSAQAPVVMFRYLAEEQNLSSLLEVGKRFLQSARAGGALPETMARLARLFEAAGKTEEARDAYLAAFAKGAPASALESAFLLSLEMNDVDALQSGLASMKDSETERVDFLRACVSFQKGETPGRQMRSLRGLRIRPQISLWS